MTIDGYKPGFNNTNNSGEIPRTQKSTKKQPKSSGKEKNPSHTRLHQQIPYNSMEFDHPQQSLNQRGLVLFKLENVEDRPGSAMQVEEEHMGEVKEEPGIESPKKLLGINEIKTGIKRINPNYNPNKEIGVENCLPCTISFYNWILSGSAFPETVDPHAKPLFEHMFPASGDYCLLLDPHLEKLKNQKTIHEIDENGEIEEFICLSEERPLTFASVPLTGLEEKIKNDIPWKQYENGGETFKLGILFLNHRDDEANAHFLNFLYRRNPKTGADTLYIIDPQSKHISTYKQFLKDYRYSYADDIKLWSGQNQINFNCNRTVKELVGDLKMEEEELVLPKSTRTNDPARVHEVAKNKLKIKAGKKRNEKPDLAPEVTKKSKRDDDLGAISKETEHTYDNPWARLGERLSLQTGGPEEDIDEIIEIEKNDQEKERMPSRMPVWFSDNPLEYSTDSTEPDSLTEEFDFSNEDDDIGPEASVKPNVIEIPQERNVRQVNNTNSIAIPESENKESSYSNQVNLDLTPVKDLGSSEANFTAGVDCYFGRGGVPQDYGRAFEYFQFAAKSGNFQAMSNLGVMYYKGRGTPQNYNLAFKYSKLSADLGNFAAMAMLTKMYYYGYGVEKDYKQAFEYSLKAAKSGLPFAQYNVGIMFLRGIGVERDFDLGVQYVHGANKSGHSDAQADLGYMHLKGLFGVSQSNGLATQYFELAAKQGHVGAQKALEMIRDTNAGTKDIEIYFKHLADKPENISNELTVVNLGSIEANLNAAHYYYGHYGHGGMHQDYNLAFQYYMHAAQLGSVEAYARLGVMCYEGKGVPPSQYLTQYQRAADWFKYPANRGHAVAQLYLGELYLKGLGVPQDFSLAAKYIKLAADQGNVKAQNLLTQIPRQDFLALNQDNVQTQYKPSATSYQSGDFTQHEREKMQQIYKKEFPSWKELADRGDAFHQYTVGYMFLEGVGVEKNDAEAFKYLKLAADAGKAEAQALIGDMYLNGKGVTSDYKHAQYYFKLAAEQGNVTAQAKLGEMYYSGNGVKQDFRLAHAYLQYAAEQGDVISQVLLGHMYLNGKSGVKSSEQAFKYYKEAADQGHAIAQYYVGIMFLEGVIGTPKDVDNATFYLKKAADQGHLKAQVQLNRILQLNKQELERLQISVSHPNPNPVEQYELGLMYFEGKKVEKNEKEAFKYLKLAADAKAITSHPSQYVDLELREKKLIAQLKVAEMYMEGKVVEQDFATAVYYLKIVSEEVHTVGQRHITAQKMLALIYLEGRRGVPQDINRAMSILKYYAEIRNTTVEAIINEIRRDGIVPKDIKKDV